MADAPHSRRQLTLYVPAEAAAELEAMRRVLDPVQSGLIPAHVTLCREDELEQLSFPELRRQAGTLGAITLHFGRPEAFHEHGILLPCVGGQDEFHALRRRLLGSSDIRRPEPHITLAHPRNPKAPGSSLATAASLPADLSISFDTIRLIQQEGTARWDVLELFGL